MTTSQLIAMKNKQILNQTKQTERYKILLYSLLVYIEEYKRYDFMLYEDKFEFYDREFGLTEEEYKEIMR